MTCYLTYAGRAACPVSAEVYAEVRDEASFWLPDQVLDGNCFDGEVWRHGGFVKVSGHIKPEEPAIDPCK